VRAKLSVETNFQVSTANAVPVISIQNKIKQKFGGNFTPEKMLEI